jgi:DNA polymerase (family X)
MSGSILERGPTGHVGPSVGSFMAKLDASQVAALLAEYGSRSALRGGNSYRFKAYVRAAENLAALAEPLDRIVGEGRLREIQGVGDSIADIITKLHRTGTHPSLEKLRKEVRQSVLDMLSIPGLRPDKVLKLHKELGINSIAELEAAARQDRLKPIRGLGAALQRKILQGIEIRRAAKGARHIHRAGALLDAAAMNLARSDSGLTRIQPAGDFRRGAELVFDLSVVAQSARVKDGPTVLKNGDLSIHITDRKRYGITQLLTTGSDRHLDELHALAKKKGLEITEDGLRRRKKIIAAETEAQIYSALGLQFVEPELREGRGEVAAAAANELPKLVTDKDIRGILHAHTERSDGVNTLEQMAEATRNRGYEYFGVADHSKSAHYAGGLSVEEIAEQRAEADTLNRKYAGGFRIFKGIESDILPDGSLDYPDGVLETFDFVVASVHGQFRKDKKEQTERILRAVASPHVTILGHMTGRQLLRRPGYEVDIEKILEACARHCVAIEINANPWRLDLDWRWHSLALEFGCMMSINPDAHSTNEIDLTHWGVEMARKGGVPADRVINAMGLQEFTSWLKRRDRLGRSLRRNGNARHGRRRLRTPESPKQTPGCDDKLKPPAFARSGRF